MEASSIFSLTFGNTHNKCLSQLCVHNKATKLQGLKTVTITYLTHGLMTQTGLSWVVILVFAGLICMAAGECGCRVESISHMTQS